MIILEDIKTLVKLLPFEQDVKDSIVNNTEEIMKFNSFISQKYTLTQKEAESQVQIKLESMYKEIDPLTINDPVETSANNAREYSKSEGYDRFEELKEAIINLSNSLKHFTNQ